MNDNKKQKFEYDTLNVKFNSKRSEMQMSRETIWHLYKYSSFIYILPFYPKFRSQIRID